MTHLIHVRALIFLSVIAIFLGTFGIARAVSVFDIVFPVAELGNCADRVACKAYCEDVAHRDACHSFAKTYGLTVRTQSPEDSGEKVRAILKDGGPGNCAVDVIDPMRACRAYCADSANTKTCMAYAKNHSLYKGAKLLQAQKMMEKSMRMGSTTPGQQMLRDDRGAMPSQITDGQGFKNGSTTPYTKPMRQGAKMKQMPQGIQKRFPFSRPPAGVSDRMDQTNVPTSATIQPSPTSFIGIIQQMAAATFSFGF